MADIAQLDTVLRGLFLGQKIASGADSYRLVQARGKLLAFQDLSTGRITGNAAQVLKDNVRKRLAQRDAILRDLASEMVLLLAKDLKQLTGTQYATLAQLAAMGHPYAKAHFRDARGRFNPSVARSKRGRGGLPTGPGVINNQSLGPANLTESFTYSEALTPGGIYAVTVESSSPYAGFLAAGTDTMIGRAYDQQAARLAHQQISGKAREAAAKLEALGEAVPGLKAPEVDFKLGSLDRRYKGQ